MNPAYPAELNTLGDHLRKTRLDRGLSQSDVARILNVASDTVTGWELNRCQPSLKFVKAIIAFLGWYNPFEMNNLSLGKQLYYARLITGMTQEQVAKQIGCDDDSFLRPIESGQRTPVQNIRERVQSFIDAALDLFKNEGL